MELKQRKERSKREVENGEVTFFHKFSQLSSLADPCGQIFWLFDSPLSMLSTTLTKLHSMKLIIKAHILFFYKKWAKPGFFLFIFILFTRKEKFYY